MAMGSNNEDRIAYLERMIEKFPDDPAASDWQQELTILKCDHDWLDLKLWPDAMYGEVGKTHRCTKCDSLR